jgi:hypothetical protein
LQLNEAFELERARSKGFGGIGKQTKEEALLKAASIYAKLGYMRQYCDIMAELGDWSKALALAPVVSMEYWKQMAEKRARILALEDDFSCVPLLVASGRAHEASDFLAGNGALEDAFCIAQVCGMVSILGIECSSHLMSPPSRARMHLRRADKCKWCMSSCIAPCMFCGRARENAMLRSLMSVLPCAGRV